MVIHKKPLTFPVKQFPEALHRDASNRAKREGRSLRSVVLDLLRYYVEFGIPPFRQVR